MIVRLESLDHLIRKSLNLSRHRETSESKIQDLKKESFKTVELSQFQKSVLPEPKKIKNQNDIKPIFIKSNKFRNMIPELGKVKSKKEILPRNLFGFA